jgi:Transposase DDE domain group 1/Transposase domain (DUF772)
LDTAALVGHLVPAGSVYAFLAEHRQQVFPDGLFADLFPSGKGRPSVPGEVIASVLVLQTLQDLSDAETEAMQALRCDLRWKVACGLPIDHEGFLDTDGDPRDSAEVCEISGLLPPDLTGNYPPGTRFLVRRERPHPGAQLSMFDTIEGFRHQVMATDTPPGHGSIQLLEARHRAHARVEDRIRCGKDTGFGRFPSRLFAINAAWLELALTGIDLLAWTQHLLLDGDLTHAEPKKLRYRLLHVPARITRSARRIRLRIAEQWP